MKQIVKFLTIALTLVSCGQVPSRNIDETKSGSKYSKNDVAIFTISAIMGQPDSIISVKQEDNIYLLSYVRPSDGQPFQYRVKFENNNHVMWASIDGRWRDSVLDEKISYEEEGDKLIITQLFSDGSTIDKEFKKKN